MNEQILTKLVIRSSDKDGWLDRQKFAELIVRECVYGIKRDGWYWNTNSVEELCEKMEKHFGVE